MREVTVAFSNLWGADRNFSADYLYDLFPYLRGHVRFTLSRYPELIIYSAYGYVKNHGHGCKRLLIAGEPGRNYPDGKFSSEYIQPNFYTHGMTCDLENQSPNHIYYPQPLLHLQLYNEGVNSLIRTAPLTPEKEFFCNFIYSNGYSKDRVDFFRALSKYKRVESLGAVERNNFTDIGHGYDKAGYLAKQAFQSRCKFSICFENTYFPGYHTEKLTDAFIAGSVPIYRGDPNVEDLYNGYALVNWDRFKSDEACIEYVKYLDGNDAAYRRILNEPPFYDNKVPERISDATYLKFWKEMLA